MVRYAYIEKILRQVYGSQPVDDSTISFNLVNQWLSEGVALAAKKCYTDNAQLDGIACVNNGFYLTYKGIAISKYENFVYRITLPEIPVGLGKNEGVSVLTFQDANGNVSFPSVPLSTNQATYYRSMRPIQNKTLHIPQGIFLDVVSAIQLNIGYTANVTMISSGDSTNLDSVFNIPPDYIPIVDEFVSKQLLIERAQPQDTINDGVDMPSAKP